MTGWAGDHGRVSVLLAITATGIFAVIGAAADAAGQFRTMQYVDSVAAEAARTAGQAIDIEHTAATGQHRISPLAAEQAARAYLDQAGVDGQVTVSQDLTQVTVTVHHTYQPRILHLFGWTPPRLTGRHTAALIVD
jgi:Flp pilus assembly protein TadG